MLCSADKPPLTLDSPQQQVFLQSFIGFLTVMTANMVIRKIGKIGCAVLRRRIKMKRERLRERTVYQILAHMIMITLCILVLLPFMVLLMSSFTDETAAIVNGYSPVSGKFSLEA